MFEKNETRAPQGRRTGVDPVFLVSWPGGSWQATAVYAAVIFATYLAAFWLALVFWTARDIRQRSASPATQLAAPLLVLLFFLPGHWLYLVMRPRYTREQQYVRALEEEALRLDLDQQISCPACSRHVREDFLVCPACRTQLKQACSKCRKPLANAWVACPYCGLDRSAEPAPQVAAGGTEETPAQPVEGPPVPVVMTAVAANASDNSQQAAS